MSKTLPNRILGYALNCFPYQTLDQLWACLQTDVLEIKRRVVPDEPFPIELRLSEALARDLACDCRQVSRLRSFLDAHDLALVTINGFVMPAFHGQPVKQRVYLPAWHESEARLRFTCECLDLLALLAPMPGILAAPDPWLSVSVPFGALKPVSMDSIAPNILRAGSHARRVRERTGARIVVALEPEPGLCVETTPEVIAFFERYVPPDMRPFLTVNFDLSHHLVQFEDVVDAANRLTQAGIVVSKVHVTNAACFERWAPFYPDSIYLHQVVGVDADGRRCFFSLDWPTEPPPPAVVRFRCHYHLPVCDLALWTVGTTQVDVERFLRESTMMEATPYVIETYTWPEQLRGQLNLVSNICRELVWVREKMGLSAGYGRR